MAKFGFEAAFAKTDEEINKNQPVAKLDYFKAEETPKIIRFVTEDNDAGSVVTYTEHYVQFHSTWSKSYACADGDNDGPSRCMLCGIKSGKEVIKNDCGVKFLTLVVERDARNKDGEVADRLKQWKLSPYVMTNLKGYFEKYGTLGDRDYRIALIDNPDKNSKVKKIYMIEPVTKRAEELDDETRELIKSRPSLDSLIPAYDEKDININITRKSKEETKAETKQNIKKILDDEDDDDTVASPKKSFTLDDDDDMPSKSKSVLDDDDDEDNIELFRKLRNKKI